MKTGSIEGAMLNWSARYLGHAGQLLMTTGSTDQTGNYVFEIMPVRVSDAVGLQLPYWNTARGNDTMYSLWNPGSTAQRVVLTLCSADGMHTYAVPETLGPGASAMVDIGMLRREGVADPSGNLLPPEVQDGSAMLEPAAALKPNKNGVVTLPASGPAEMQVAVSVGIFNAAAATCCSQCMYCCFYTCPAVESLLVNTGSSGNSTFEMEDCCGYEDNFSNSASWSTGDNAIMNSEGEGTFGAPGVGETELSAQAYVQTLQASGPYCAGGCKKGYHGGRNFGQAQPILTSVVDTGVDGPSGLDRHAVPVLTGGAANGVNAVRLAATCNTGGTGGTPSYSWTSGNASVVTTDGSTNAGSTITGAAAGATTVNVTCSLDGETSAAYSYSITAQQPSKIVPATASGNTSGPCTDKGSAACGDQRTPFEWQVEDQSGNPIFFSGMEFWDTMAATQKNDFGIGPGSETLTCPSDQECGKVTDVNGQFQEANLGICATLCVSGGVCITGPESAMTWGYFVNGWWTGNHALNYYCNLITIDGN